MLKRFVSIACVVLISLFVVGNAFAEDSTYDRIMQRHKLIAATCPGYFPFEMTGKNGSLIGYDIDIAKYIAKELKVPVEFVPYDFEAVIPALAEKKADIIIAAMNITPERAKVVSFSAPYFKTGLGLLVNSKHPNIKSWADLDKKGIKIGVMSGYLANFHASKYFKKADVIQYTGSAEAIGTAVSQGKLDACVHDAPWCAVYARKNPKGVYTFVKSNGTEEPMGIAFQKDDIKMQKFLNSALKKLKNSPKHNEMYKYWFVDMPWMSEVK